jgi:hypothetical protein
MKLDALLPTMILSAVLPSALAHDAYYYTDYTNAATGLSLSLSPTEAAYWDGSTVNLQVAGYGCSWISGANPGVSLLINCLIDDAQLSTTNMYWSYYSPNLVTNPIPLRGLPVGTHTVTVRQTNSVEYYTEYRFLYYSTHLNYWHTITYYHNYYAVYHYWTVPCSASQTFTVKPSPNFRKLQIRLTNDVATITYTGIPTNNYGFYFSFDLANWYLLGVRKTSTNGLAEILDGVDSGARYYRAYGP